MSLPGLAPVSIEEFGLEQETKLFTHDIDTETGESSAEIYAMAKNVIPPGMSPDDWQFMEASIAEMFDIPPVEWIDLDDENLVKKAAENLAELRFDDIHKSSHRSPKWANLADPKRYDIQARLNNSYNNGYPPHFVLAIPPLDEFANLFGDEKCVIIVSMEEESVVTVGKMDWLYQWLKSR